MGLTDETVRFGFDGNRRKEVSETLTIACQTLEGRGYNPVDQIVSYSFSGDPIYIPHYHDARDLIRRHEHGGIMEVIIKDYLSDHGVSLWG